MVLLLPNVLLLKKDKNVSILYSLVSEDFCATIEIDIGLTATMLSYEDSTFVTLKTAFIVGRDVFFKIVVYSDVKTVAFQATALTEAKFVLKADGKVASAISVYKKGVTDDCKNTDCNFKVIIRTDPSEAAFSFNVTSKLIDRSAGAAAGSPTLKTNSKISFTVQTVVQVSYLDSSTSKKRGLMGLLGETASAQSAGSSEYDMDVAGTSTITFDTGATANTVPTETTNSGSIMIVSLLSFIVAFFF